jgi:hypothetical protein
VIRLAHCTFAVTVAVPLIVKVHEVLLDPPLEQLPDQIAERPVVTVSVTEVPTAKDAEPLPPVVTLMPAGLEDTRWPLRPVTFTVSVAFCGGGGAAAAVTVSVAVVVTPPQLAEIVTCVEVLTAEVEIGNVKVLEGAATVTVAGTVAAPGLLLDSDTVAAPPCGGGPDSLTVPLAPSPPVTVDGLTEMLCNVTGGGSPAGVVTVSVPVRVPPLYEAVIVTVFDAVTVDVLIVNPPVKLFPGTVTVAGTLAVDGSLLDSVITAPASGAGVLITIVPDDAFPPTTVVGLMSTVETADGGGESPAMKVRTAENGPAWPALLIPRTRHEYVVPVVSPLVT